MSNEGFTGFHSFQRKENNSWTLLLSSSLVRYSSGDSSGNRGDWKYKLDLDMSALDSGIMDPWDLGIYIHDEISTLFDQ